VGIQCVDCVRESAKQAPRTTTAMGGRIHGRRNLVTLSLIGICVASFVLQLVTRGGWTQLFQFFPGAGLAEPWRFVTAAFLHSTGFLGHILFNMWALYITGQFLEPVLGRARFILLALLSAVGGSVGVVLLTSPTPTPFGWVWGPAVVGASGMVFGLFGAMVAVLRRFGANAAQMVGLIVINGIIGFVVPGIAWQAHLGGLVVGFVLGWGFSHAPRNRQRTVLWALPTAVAVVLVGATLLRYSATPWL